MIDFNSSAQLGERIAALIDRAMQREAADKPPRQYLGASRVGIACERALQLEYAKAPVDPGREHPGRLLRVFERGHLIEAAMIRWLRAAGFDLRTEDSQGRQFGFSSAGGRLAGHIDGVILDGPAGFAYPMLWENKCVGAKTFRELRNAKLAKARPVYAAQVALYQAYMGLHEAPALFTAVNADTMDIHAEAVPFDAALAQRMSDRAVRVIDATATDELLPRAFHDSTHFECRACAWQDRCWSQP